MIHHNRAICAVAALAILAIAICVSNGHATAQQYDRSKYYTKAPRQPFTFTSTYTLTSQGIQDAIRIEAAEAEDSMGHVFEDRRTFNPATGPATTYSGSIVSRLTGDLTVFFWSKWQYALGKPVMVSYAQGRRFIREHTLPENNCVAPEPHLRFLRVEPVMINGVEYRAAVVQEDGDIGGLAWHALSPGLGCLELKSVVTYTAADTGKPGKTIHEPISLALGEPDAVLFSVEARFPDQPTEVVGFQDWERILKERTELYKSTAQNQMR